VPLLTKGFDPLALADKFLKHGTDVKALTMVEYEQMADAFLGGPLRSTMRQCVRSRGGDTLRFDVSTEEFGILSAAGQIKTYYVPDRAVHRQASNFDYFLQRCKQ